MNARDDPGGETRGKVAHERAAKTHDRAAELHEESASFHEQHAVEMDEKGHPEWVERAHRIADHERELAERERTRGDEHRRSAQAEPAPEN